MYTPSSNDELAVPSASGRADGLIALALPAHDLAGGAARVNLAPVVRAHQTRQGGRAKIPVLCGRARFAGESPPRHHHITSLQHVDHRVTTVLQNTACCESHPIGSYKALGCLGPKCSALGLPPDSLLTRELDQLSEYFPLFDRVYVGTTAQEGFTPKNRSAIAPFAKLQGSIGAQFMDRYGAVKGAHYGWYITTEGSVYNVATEENGTEPGLRAGWHDFLAQTSTALHAVRPPEFLWSPSNGDITPDAAQRAEEEARRRALFWLSGSARLTQHGGHLFGRPASRSCSAACRTPSPSTSRIGWASPRPSSSRLSTTTRSNSAARATRFRRTRCCSACEASALPAYARSR